MSIWKPRWRWKRQPRQGVWRRRTSSRVTTHSLKKDPCGLTAVKLEARGKADEKRDLRQKSGEARSARDREHGRAPNRSGAAGVLGEENRNLRGHSAPLGVIDRRTRQPRGWVCIGARR